MVSDRIHAPDEIVQAQAHPRQWHVVTQQPGGPHPREMRPAESTKARVVGEVLKVVPVQELVMHGGLEDQKCDDRDTGCDPPAQVPTLWPLTSTALSNGGAGGRDPEVGRFRCGSPGRARRASPPARLRTGSGARGSCG